MLYRNDHTSAYWKPALGLVLTLFWLPEITQARSLIDCEQSVRVGNRLVLRGDDGQRADSLLARHPQWKLQRRSTKQMVWVRSGRNPATLRLKMKNGVISALCLRE